MMTVMHKVLLKVLSSSGHVIADTTIDKTIATKNTSKILQTTFAEINRTLSGVMKAREVT